MSTAPVTLGPVASASVLAWASSANETLRVARAHPGLGVPSQVLDAFQGYVNEWEQAALEADPFVWSGQVETALLRVLGAHWARLVTIARRDPSSGLHPAPPEGEAFYNALAIAILEAASIDDAEGFSERFEEVVPPFDLREPPAGSEDRRRVLVVEDTEDIRLLMRLALERDGRFEVIGEAANGAEAVALCATGCPDAVLLDLMMPEMDGYTALPILKQRCPETNVVVFTAHATPDVRARVRQLGASACLSKSAPTDTVLSALAIG